MFSLNWLQFSVSEILFVVAWAHCLITYEKIISGDKTGFLNVIKHSSFQRGMVDFCHPQC